MHQGGVVMKDVDLAGGLHHARLVPAGQRGQMGQIPPAAKPEGFRTRAGLQSLSKFSVAALQPQIYGNVSAWRVVPAGGNAPGDGGAR